MEVRVVGSGVVSVVDVAINCGTDCFENVSPGQLVTLRATPRAGFVFDGWGGACQGAAETCQVTVTVARTVVASFSAPRTLDQPIDAVIAAMPPNSWKVLPGTKMGDMCPLPFQGYYCSSVISAWSGGAYDARRDRMLVYGGGHSDSYYNNIFSFDLASMRWERLNEMPAGTNGETPGPGWTDKRAETCGFYPKGEIVLPPGFPLTGSGYIRPEDCFSDPVLSQLDLQQPRSAHTYGKFLYDHLRDRYCYLGGDTFPSAQMDSYVAYCFDPVSRLWELVAERPRKATGRGQAAVDAAGDWWYVTDGNANILRFEPIADRWTEYGNINYEAGGGSDIDRLRGHLWTMHYSGSTYLMRRFDLNSEASLRARPAYTQFDDVTDMPSNLGTRPGFVYADGLDLFFAWGGGRDVHVFDPQTRRWSKRAGTGDAPGAQQANGTFGRWRYSTARKVFVLVNSTTEDVYLFKPGL